MSEDAAGLELAEVAVSADPPPRRAEELLTALRRVVPFDAAWLALTDLHHPRYSTLASVDLSDSVLTYFTGPAHAHDIEVTGTNRATPPMSPSDLSFPAAELPSWAECLLPAGFCEGFGVGLFASDGRHVGFLGLLSGSRDPPSQAARRTLGQLLSVLARGIDPMLSLLAIGRLVQGASAGVVLSTEGGVEVLPGMQGHLLLAAGSSALAAARAALVTGRIYRSFLWPLGGRHAPAGHVRITTLGSTGELPIRLLGLALVSPPGDLRGLTPRELEVLGLVIEGFSNATIARALVIAPRTVAAHLEHILAKLSAPSRTLAAVRAERAGLYVPPQPATSPQHP